MLRLKLQENYNHAVSKKEKIAKKTITKEEKIAIRNKKKNDRISKKYKKILPQKIWNLGMLYLKNNIKDGKSLESALTLKDIDPKYAKYYDEDIDKILSEKAILNGISFIHKKRGGSPNNDSFLFNVEKYHANSMYEYVARYVYITSLETPFNELEKYLYEEKQYYKMLKNGSVIENDEKNIKDSYYTAAYRLGYDTEPTYEKYLKRVEDKIKDKKYSTEYLYDFLTISQYIRNCIEISHIVNKQNNEKKENFTTKLRIRKN